jgi:hypothetical protein
VTIQTLRPSELVAQNGVFGQADGVRTFAGLYSKLPEDKAIDPTANPKQLTDARGSVDSFIGQGEYAAICAPTV